VIRAGAAALGLAVLVAAGPAAARPDGVETGWRGAGRVVAIDRAAGRLTLDHGPIGELLRAGRTEFPVGAPGLPESLRVGDGIGFVVTADADAHGVLSLSDVRPLGAEGPGAAAGTLLAGPVGMALVLSLSAIAVGLGVECRRLRRRVERADAAAASLRDHGRRQREALADLEREWTALIHLVRRQQADLRQVSARLPHAVADAAPDPPAPDGEAPRPLVLVRRGETATFRFLDERLGKPGAARVIWDRRRRERRVITRPGGPDRRRRERRGPAPATWDHLGCLFVEPPDQPGGLIAGARPGRSAPRLPGRLSRAGGELRAPPPDPPSGLSGAHLARTIPSQAFSLARGSGTAASSGSAG
jgi:hypothetical protein